MRLTILTPTIRYVVHDLSGLGSRLLPYWVVDQMHNRVVEECPTAFAAEACCEMLNLQE